MTHWFVSPRQISFPSSVHISRRRHNRKCVCHTTCVCLFACMCVCACELMSCSAHSVIQLHNLLQVSLEGRKSAKIVFPLSLCLFFCFLLRVLNNGRCAVEGGNVKRTGSGVEWRLSGSFARRRLTWKSTWLSRDPSPADGRRKKKKKKTLLSYIFISHTHICVST